MTMLDDDQLATLFARTAADFELPESGPAEIVARARRDGPQAGEAGAGGDAVGDPGGDADAPSRWREGRLRRAGAAAARHRVLAVAACLVVVLAAAGIVGALGRGTSSPTATSSLRPLRASTPPRAGSSPVTTTVPRPGLNHAGSAVGSAAAPLQPRATGQPNASVPSTTVPGQGAAALPFGAVGQPARIQQTGSLGLTVKPGALNRTMTQLSAIATGVGGFVASSQTRTATGPDGPASGTITLQVPVADFAGVLKQAQALGQTSNLTTKATDVTGQYVDLQARLDALEATRQQYLSILAKATSIGDILSVQEELDSVQTQIEQLQGQLQLLSSQTAYSTATVTVNERPAPPRSSPAPDTGVVKSWHDSLHGFAAGVEGVIRYAGPVLFAVICLGLFWLGGRTLWRRYQRHNL
jgi:Domain of unknown function (DUF4349)